MYFVNSFFVDSFREMIKKYGEMEFTVAEYIDDTLKVH